MKITESKLRKMIREELLNEADEVSQQLKMLKQLLKRTGASLEVKGSTIIIDLKTGGVQGSMEFQWPRIIR